MGPSLLGWKTRTINTVIRVQISRNLVIGFLLLFGATLLPAAANAKGDARPHAWCGWYARHNFVGQDPGQSFNLARNWAHWGHAVSGPAPGVIGVKAHHVFKVIAVLSPGRVLAISGNDSHAVRTRARSTAGVIAWRAG